MSKVYSSTLISILALTWVAWALTDAAAQPLLSLDELLKEYKALGLPLPPKKAKLVRYEAGGGKPTVYGLAFEVKPGTKTEKPVLLIGTWRSHLIYDPHPQPVAPEPAAIKDLKVYQDDGLALAIQCHARGWDKLAQRILEKSQKDATLPPRKQLIQLAWYYWEGHLTEPGTDWAPIARRLKDLIRRDKKLDTEGHRALLKSLDLALMPSNAKPGSVEALIDDLVNYHSDGRVFFNDMPQGRYWRIVRLGFAAVPALIEHLDDDRLTRAMMPVFNNYGGYHLRVQHVVSDLLEGLAGRYLERKGLGALQGYPVEKADALAWWKEARKVGEETYLLDHVLVGPTDQEKQSRISMHLLSVIVAKYPKDIPSLYHKFLDRRPEFDSGSLVDAIRQSKLPAKDQLKLILYGARHKDNHHRLPALLALKDMDKKQFNALLLATVEAFPKDVADSYRGCPEVGIAGLAVESDDPRIWPLLEKVAKRSAVGLRMELLDIMGNREDNRHRSERLRLLAHFLDDGTVRNLHRSSKFEGICAGDDYDEIEVRDFAALKIAELVGMKVEVNPRRTAAEWARIRSRVREALKRELGKAN
jgi:hypothetical protein